MTDKQIIEVVSAHMEGKQIQHRSKGTEKWNDTDSPNWNFYVLDYRVKPEKKYRPFKNADEAFREAKKHGFWVKVKLAYHSIINIDDDINGCIFGGSIPVDAITSFDELSEYEWADDGTPCGVLDAE